jgi:aspartyl-tRNA(Asn)/glutamyl-tRNA(Gln) amidotransferase subunit A
MAVSWTLDKLGPLCRTADDCGLVLAAIAGRDPLDSTSAARAFAYPGRPPRASLTKGRGKRFRVGVINDSAARVQPEVKSNFRAAIDVLRQFCEIDEAVAFPNMPFGPVVSTIVGAEGASAFRELLETGEATKLRAADDRWGGYASSMVLAVDYLHAMRVRGAMKRELDDLYSRFDALVAPSRASVAFPIGVDFEKVYPGVDAGPAVIPAGNAVGQPAISVPNGFGANNLPTAIQFTGRAWSEATLLAIATAYQHATGWHTKRPPIR